MKKTLIVLIGMLVITGTVFAKPAATNQQTSAAIKLYKAGDYTNSYVSFSNIVNKDPSNALAYYYLGMSSVQLGKRDEAIENYQKAVDLSPNGILGSYAKKGILCIEEPESCHASTNSNNDNESPEDKFIRSSFGSGFSQKARGTHEKEKIENIRREINRNNEIPPQQFKEYRDFSSQAPTNDEIVAAMRVLQAAGIGFGNRQISDIDSLLGVNNSANRSGYEVLNLLMNGNQGRNSNIDPQIIQSMLTNQMTASF